jgi:hypothetical protein
MLINHDDDDDDYGDDGSIIRDLLYSPIGLEDSLS